MRLLRLSVASYLTLAVIFLTSARAIPVTSCCQTVGDLHTGSRFLFLMRRLSTTYRITYSASSSQRKKASYRSCQTG